MTAALFDIPAGWTWKTMGDIAEVVGGGTPRTSDHENYQNGTIPWITPADLSGYTAKHIGYGGRSITQKGLETSSARMMPEGTVLFSSRAPIGYVAIASNPVCTNQGFKSFVLRTKDVLPDYVYWWLKGAKKIAEEQASGTTFLELSGAKAKQLPIPIAPLDQQQRIVAEIEKAFSRLDEAVANLKRVKANLKRYKAAVLKAAVEGKLVATEAELVPRDGRSFETGTQLLQRILESRRSQWEGKGKYKEPAAPDTIDFHKLPRGWGWAAVDQLVSSVTDGDHQPPPQTERGIPFLVIGNVRSGRIDFSGTRFVGETYYKSLDHRRQPKQGDLLYTLVGSYGIAVRVQTDRPFCIQRHMAILRPHEHSPMDYLAFAMASDVVFRQATAVATGTAQKTVPLAGLRKIAIPLPPLAEQKRIVAEVERRLSLIRGIKAEVDANLRRTGRLRQAVLAMVFSADGSQADNALTWQSADSEC